jgi:hypothetical protein
MRGARAFPDKFRKKCGLVVVAAGPVVLHVGISFDESTDGAAYEPTEGATTDPYPESPGACASANVLVRVKTVASAIVVSFMVVSFLYQIRGCRTVTIKIFVRRSTPPSRRGGLHGALSRTG